MEASEPFPSERLGAPPPPIKPGILFDLVQQSKATRGWRSTSTEHVISAMSESLRSLVRPAGQVLVFAFG
jgi:hypothetical protein